MKKFMDKLFQRLHDNYYTILEICSNPHKFCLIWTIAQIDIQHCHEFVASGFVVEGEIQLVMQLNLDMKEDTASKKKTLHEHLVRQHRERYGSERLGKILDKIFQSVTEASHFHNLLTLATDPNRFCITAIDAELAINVKKPFHFKPISRFLSKLVQRSDLYKADDLDLWLQAFHESVLEAFGFCYRIDALRQLLEKVMNGKPWPKSFMDFLLIRTDRKSNFLLDLIPCQSGFR